MVSQVLQLCKECALLDPSEGLEGLRKCIIGSSPSTTLYILEVCSVDVLDVWYFNALFCTQILHSVLMPALDNENFDFQVQRGSGICTVHTCICWYSNFLLYCTDEKKVEWYCYFNLCFRIIMHQL